MKHQRLPYPYLMACFVMILIGVSSIAVCAEEKEVDDLGEGRKWIPEFSFPPSDPTREAGYLPLWGRDLSLQWGRTNLYLSKKRGLELTFENNDFYLKIGGRAYVDLVKYVEDKNELGGNGFGLRNIMVEMNGRFKPNWLYRLSWGGFTSGGRFDGSGAFIDDLFVSYTGLKKFAFTAGQHGEPFSLEEMTSSLSITFMETALSDALTPGTSLGVSFNTYQTWWGASAGLFAEDLKSSKDIGDQGYGLTGRVHFNPGHREDRLWHVGGSFSLRDISETDSFFFRKRPETGLTDVRYVDTGDIQNTEVVARFCAETALVAGPFSFQGEYVGAYVERKTGFDDLMFEGWYVFGSWFPTGESRKYFPEEGIFGYPEINGKYGAVELATRYSHLDLNDGPIRGGRERNITFGVNWYLSPKIRMMANYILVFTDDDADANGTLEGDDRPQILQMRFQFRL